MIVYKYLDKKNQTKVQNETSGDFFLQKSLKAIKYPNAFVLPYRNGGKEGCVLTNGGIPIKNTTLHEEFTEYNDVVDKTNCPQIHKNAIFIGTLFSVFGHVITDDIKKIWYLRTKECQKLIEEGADVIYLAWHNIELKSYVSQILEYGGASLSCAICVTQNVQYDNIYVPNDSLIIKGNRRFYTQKFRETIDIIKQKGLTCSLGAKVYRKIYLSRTALHDWRDYGEKKIEKTFEKRGFKIIYPEQIPFSEQIWLYSHCKEIASTEGSLSHMFMFCEPNTQVVLLRKANYVNSYQAMLNSMAGLNVVYIDANRTLSRKHPWDGPFYLYLTQHLKNFLGIKCLYTKWLDIEFYIYLLRYIRVCFVK